MWKNGNDASPTACGGGAAAARAAGGADQRRRHCPTEERVERGWWCGCGCCRRRPWGTRWSPTCRGWWRRRRARCRPPGSAPGSATGDARRPRRAPWRRARRRRGTTTTVRTSSDGSSSTSRSRRSPSISSADAAESRSAYSSSCPSPPGVQADGDRSDRLARPERDGPLRVVAHADGHAVALADTLCEQVVRQLADAARGPRRTSWSRRRSAKNRASPNAAVAFHTSRMLAGALTYTRRGTPPIVGLTDLEGRSRSGEGGDRFVSSGHRRGTYQRWPTQPPRGRAPRRPRCTSDRPRCRRCSARRRWPRRRRPRRRTGPRRVPAAATSAARTRPSPRRRRRAAAPPATGGWPRRPGRTARSRGARRW